MIDDHISSKAAKKIREGIFCYDLAAWLCGENNTNILVALNFKAQALISIGEFEEAVEVFKQIKRIDFDLYGPFENGAYGNLAQQFIDEYSGRSSEPIPVNIELLEYMGEPEWCFMARRFCVLMSRKKFNDAFKFVSPNWVETIDRLKDEWKRIIGFGTITSTKLIDYKSNVLENKESKHCVVEIGLGDTKVVLRFQIVGSHKRYFAIVGVERV